MAVLVGPRRGAERLLSAIGVALVQALLGYALFVGLRTGRAPVADEALKIFAVLPERPPLPPQQRPVPQSKPRHDPGAPRDQARRPTPMAAPVPLVSLRPPPPIVVAPTPATDAGRAIGTTDPGEGAGLGGTGWGSGNGAGGGGRLAQRARQIKGRFRDSDFPRSARDAGSLRIGVRYVVEPDGRVGSCAVVEPSGYAEVDAITCPIIRRRYRFEPARDENGMPVAETREETEGWLPNE